MVDACSSIMPTHVHTTFIMLRTLMFFLFFEGSPWHWGIGWKRWEIRAEGEYWTYSHTVCPITHWNQVVVSLVRHACSIWPLTLLIFCYQGEAGPPGPVGPRGIPVCITSDIYMTWWDFLSIQIRVHKLDARCTLWIISSYHCDLHYL